MITDWRQIHRKADQPDVKLGDRLEGMERRSDGQWVRIAAAVEAVELLESNTDGSRVFSVGLGPSIRVETPQ
jgi:hypothetical protein